MFISKSAIKGVKGSPNGSCILTLRDRPSPERCSPGAPQPPPRTLLLIHPSLARRTGRTRPAVLCAAWRAAAHAPRHRPSREPGEKRRAPLLTGPFPLQLPLPDRVVSTIAQKPRPDASRTSQSPAPAETG